MKTRQKIMLHIVALVAWLPAGVLLFWFDIEFVVVLVATIAYLAVLRRVTPRCPVCRTDVYEGDHGDKTGWHVSMLPSACAKCGRLWSGE